MRSGPAAARPDGACVGAAAVAVGARLGAVPFAVSKSISGAPVAMMSPGWPCNVFTTPENGAGTSTTAFAVSTASIG